MDKSRVKIKGYPKLRKNMFTGVVNNVDCNGFKNFTKHRDSIVNRDQKIIKLQQELNDMKQLLSKLLEDRGV